jgi:nucleoside-diphosphate-sugar epimerase
MVDNGPILVTGAAGQLGAVGRTVTHLLLERGLPVRAMVRREDDRAMSSAVVDPKANTQNEYQRLSAMPIDMPPARFVAAEPGMSRKPRRS